MLSLELGQKARPLLGFGWWSVVRISVVFLASQYPKVFGRNAALCGTFLLIILEAGEEEAGCY